MKKRLLISFVSSAMFLLIFPTARAIPTLSILPPTNTLNVGQAFTVDVMISGVLDLYAYDIVLSCNPSLIGFSSASQGTFLSQGGTTLWLPPTSGVPGQIGHATEILLGAPTGVSGDGLLFSLNLQALAPGTGNLDFLNISLYDSFLNAINFQSIYAQYNILSGGGGGGGGGGGDNGNIPEPSTLVLYTLGFALSGFLLWRRRLLKCRNVS